MFLALLQWYSLSSLLNFQIAQFLFFCTVGAGQNSAKLASLATEPFFCRINHCQKGGLPAFAMIFLMNCAANFSLQTIYT
jgi:hypothetical protein